MTQLPNRSDPAGDSEDALAAQIEKLRAENAALKELIEGLQDRIAELERRLGLNSSKALLHDEGRAACVVQHSSSTRAEGAD